MTEGHDNAFAPAPPPFPIVEGDAGFGMVRTPYAANLIDEAFLGNDAVSTPDVVAQSSYVGLAVGARTLRAAFGAVALSLAIVVGRAAHVQIAQGAEYAGLAEGNRSRIVPVAVERGVMYDRDGVPLVRNVPRFSATVMPADLPKDPTARREAIGGLATVLGVTPTDIERTLEEYDEFDGEAVTVADDLTHEQAVLLDVRAATTPGIALATGMRREYLASAQAPSLSHVLGFEGRLTKEELAQARKDGYQPSDFLGKTGLEKSYEKLLRGAYGHRRVEVDATGKEKKVIAEEQGTPGNNLVLTVDLDLQRDAEEALAAGLKAAGKKRGSVIVTEPSTGAVLAMVSAPAFDNNMFARGISPEDYAALANDPDHPLFPRAVAGEIASGSVFKPIVGAAALEEGVITQHTSILSSGGLRIGVWFFPDWKAGGHGPTNLAKALAESVNTFFYVVGGGLDGSEGLGVARIVDYAKKFGLGAPLGIDLPSEAGGFLPSKEWKEQVKGERWYVGDTYHLAIGQGDVIVTPLQIAMMTGVFANGGALMRPHLVSAVTTTDGVRAPVQPQAIAPQVVGTDAVDAVRRGMRQAVTLGSARLLADLPVAVAGKTGTAQWHPTKAPHAWFTSFAPYDEPEIAVTVVIEEGEEGSRTATPVAKEIYRRWAARR